MILVMSGGNAIGPLMEVLEVLDRVPEDFTAVVITGKNEKTRRELAEAREKFHFTLHLPGYVDDMYKWMRLSDFLISKAGGLTVSEALAVGLPILVVRPTPGQEEANTEFFLKAGAGYYLKDLEDLEPVVRQLLKDPVKLGQLRENAARRGKPGAAREIIKELENWKKQQRNFLAQLRGICYNKTMRWPVQPEGGDFWAKPWLLRPSGGDGLSNICPSL